MRYRLRPLLILLAIGPPMLAGAWFESELFGLIGLLVALMVAAPIAIVLAAFAITFPVVIAIEFVEAIVRRNTNSP